ncbi:MAG: hypothetical protein K9G33_13010 [Sneathiella sp.]|nr:hypothetical protein [Sneathiella sp.]
MSNILKKPIARNLIDKEKNAVKLFSLIEESPPPLKRKPFYFSITFILFVALPIIFGTAYYGFVATDRYVSNAQLTVRSAQGGTANILGGLIGAVGGGYASASEAYIVQDYIKSRDMVDELQKSLDIRSTYSNPKADYLSRLSAEATNEELYQYFLDHIAVDYDSGTQIIDVEVQAYSADDAQMIAQMIVLLCDNLVNNIAQKSREDSLKFAKFELERAENRVEAARLKLSDFRRKYGELDPVGSAAAASGIVFSIEAEIARSQTELSTLQSYLRDDSAQVNAAKSRIKALKKQLAIERQRVAGPQDEGTFIPLLAEYEKLKIEDEFAKQAYASTGAALELARAEASRKHIYLVAFVQPSLPDEATEPDRPRMILTIIVCSLLIYGLFSLLSAAIREHARV